MNDNQHIDWHSAAVHLFTFLVGAIVIYGVAAFSTFTPFPGEWHPVLRFLDAILTVAWGVAVLNADQE